ncbi:MAG: NAD-dependent epimerase/dehydratase family protein [Nitrososphaerales archaeon]|jgi:nucleoside-diphosphate-sugar epimerase
MRILVTGINGFVGKHLSAYLRSKGFDIVGLDITEGADLRGDISSKDYVFGELAKQNFDAVIHLAALADIKKTTEDPYSTYTVNCFGTLNLLELASRKNVDRFLYASSANVYGVPADRPATEATPFNPRLPYDYSKVVSETLVRSYSIHKKLKVSITRSWLLFGEWEPQSRAFPRFVRACLANQKIPLYNSGQDVTDPTYARNYGRVAELILTKEQAVGESFNVGSGSKMSIREIAEGIKKVTNSSSELELLPPRTEFEKDPQISFPSIEKLRKKLGFEPIVSFEEGVSKVVDWIKQSG